MQRGVKKPNLTTLYQQNLTFKITVRPINSLPMGLHFHLWRRNVFESEGGTKGSVSY